MLNDLPADIDVLDNVDISNLDPMLKDYVFSSFFLARMLQKTLDENKRLKAEIEDLKAQIEDFEGIKDKFDELRAILDGLGSGAGRAAARAGLSEAEEKEITEIP